MANGNTDNTTANRPAQTAEHLETLRQLLLTDPETGDGLIIEGIPEEYRGMFSFRVRNPQAGVKWRHSIRTQEV